MSVLSIVIPCFNESGNIKPLFEEIARACAGIDFEIVFINDGSTDQTASIIQELKKNNPCIRLISFVANSGHQAALRAGIRHAQGDFIVMLDADLQHPPELIPQMLKKAQEGFDCVAMVHRARQKGLFKNTFSSIFYRLFGAASGVDIHTGASDFRIISKRVQLVLNALPERHLFLRGLLPALGFSTCYIEYVVRPRKWGRPAYTFQKSFSMGLDAIFNFSSFPITFFFYFGMIVACAAFGYGITNVVLRLTTNLNLPGYTDIIASVLFLCGLILIMLGIIGKYLQVVLDHLKGRPEYLIDRTKSDPLDPH
jgi:polyisoprenyl-phosphate glycosyltransferase